MSTTARDFCADPCASKKRSDMVNAARKLLLAVLRLLILADMVDAALLFKSLSLVKQNLQRLGQSSTEAELLRNMKEFNKSAEDLLQRTARRQQDVRNPQVRDDLAAARATLVKHSTMILTSSKLQMQNPNLAAARNNRNYILGEVEGALETIEEAAQGRLTGHNEDASNGLETILDKFEVKS